MGFGTRQLLVGQPLERVVASRAEIRVQQKGEFRVGELTFVVASGRSECPASPARLHLAALSQGVLSSRERPKRFCCCSVLEFRRMCGTCGSRGNLRWAGPRAGLGRKHMMRYAHALSVARHWWRSLPPQAPPSHFQLAVVGKCSKLLCVACHFYEDSLFPLIPK